MEMESIFLKGMRYNYCTLIDIHIICNIFMNMNEQEFEGKWIQEELS